MEHRCRRATHRRRDCRRRSRALFRYEQLSLPSASHDHRRRAGGCGLGGDRGLSAVRWNANEIPTTFMLSSVALQLLYYLVTGPLRDPLGQNFPQSALFSDAALFGTLIPGSRANTSLLLGLAATLISYVFMQHSIHGFRLIVSGLAPRAARYAGFGEARAVWIGLIAGGIGAGIAGVGEVAGPIGMLQRVLSPGYGFAAIIVAFLGGLHPIGIMFAAVLMALLYVGGDFALVSASVPNAFATIFQSLLLVFYLAGALLAVYRVRLVLAPQ